MPPAHRGHVFGLMGGEDDGVMFGEGPDDFAKAKPLLGVESGEVSARVDALT